MAMMDISTEGEHMVHPIDSRYKVKEMNAIWEEENQLVQQMRVEAALSKAISRMRPELVSPEQAEEIASAIPEVKLKRVKEIEEEIHHDVMAIVKGMAEQCPKAGGKIHLGATSADITETAKAMLIHQSVDILLQDMKALLSAVLNRAEETRDWICIDRTHGQHAVPSTHGFQLAGFADQINTAMKRIRGDKALIVGKIAGAVGTANSYTELGLDAFKLEEDVLKELGLPKGLHSRQLPPRDGALYLLSDMVIFGNVIEKMSSDFWNLSRTEISEVREATSSKQVGSSTMPHKRNPFRLERVMGMSAILRGDLVTELELNFSHARDLKQSAPYRYRYPEMFITLAYMVRMMTNIVAAMEIDKKKSFDNIFITKGSVMAERVMTELAEKGMNRQEAHEVVKRLVWRAMSEDRMAVDLMREDKHVMQFLSANELEAFMSPETYLGVAIEKTDRVIEAIRRDK
jgi:adenylosuccinate lyase